MADPIRLAEVWQVERDGQTVFELRIPTPASLEGSPLGRGVWEAYVVLAMEEAVTAYQAATVTPL